MDFERIMALERADRRAFTSKPGNDCLSVRFRFESFFCFVLFIFVLTLGTRNLTFATFIFCLSVETDPESLFLLSMRLIGWKCLSACLSGSHGPIPQATIRVC